MKLTIIAPVYNEEVLLPQFVKKISRYLTTTLPDYELIIVENGSTDRSLRIANQLAAKNKKIQVTHLPIAGYGRALIHGLKISKGEFITIFNVDFWDHNFIDLVRVDLLGYDVITGSKNISGARDLRPIGRRLVTKSFTLLLKLLLGYKGTDTHGIKIFRRKKLISTIKRCKTKTGIFDSELMIRAQREGLKILELPVEVMEIRPNRFGLKRLFHTPVDIFKLYKILAFEKK